MKYGATIWVEGPARAGIQALRIKWDSAQATAGPHMTVVYPQAVAHATSIQARAAALLRDRSPFEVTLERATDYTGLDDLDRDGTAWLRRAFPEFRNPIVLLPSAGGVDVLGLRRLLDPLFGQAPEALGHPPFVTIGQGLDEADAEEVMRSLADYRPNFSFEVRAVDVLEVDDAGGWRSLGPAQLGT
jgi:hypothetical protein